jgi:Flp pilus assembly protein TadB
MISGNAFILPAIAAIVVFMLLMVLMQMSNKQESTRERVRRMVGPDQQPQEKQPESIPDPLRQDQEMTGLATALDAFMRAIGIDTEKFRKNSHLRFQRSGVTSLSAPVYFLFFKRIGCFFFFAMAFMIFSHAGTGLHRMMYFTVSGISVFLGLLGPDTYLRNERDKREKILQRSFPDALDLLLVCVESGLALDGSLSRVCKELGRAHPAITHELNRTRLELTLLNDRAQALTNLSERTDMLAFRSLVTTLLQSEKFGTSLTETLRVLSEDFRNTRLMLAEEKAGKLPVMMTIPLITLMMPALFLIILGPAIINIMKQMKGP